MVCPTPPLSSPGLCREWFIVLLTGYDTARLFIYSPSFFIAQLFELRVKQGYFSYLRFDIFRFFNFARHNQTRTFGKMLRWHLDFSNTSAITKFCPLFLFFFFNVAAMKGNSRGLLGSYGYIFCTQRNRSVYNVVTSCRLVLNDRHADDHVRSNHPNRIPGVNSMYALISSSYFPYFAFFPVKLAGVGKERGWRDRQATKFRLLLSNVSTR